MSDLQRESETNRPQPSGATTRVSSDATSDGTSDAGTASASAPEVDKLDEVGEAERQRRREHARRIFRESRIGDLMRTLNQHALQGRGTFDEYDTGVIFKWGHGYTKRHIWVDVEGDTLRFRLLPHLRCAASVPVCDGEYHSFTRETWSIPGALLHELDRNYRHPVAEASED